MKKPSKRDPIDMISSLKIDKGIACPPVNMTSPWTYLALKMKVGDSVQLDRYEHVLKLKYALLRLGFAFVRRKFSDDCWRVWKRKKSGRSSKNPRIPKRVYFAKRSQIVTGQIELPKRRGGKR